MTENWLIQGLSTICTKGRAHHSKRNSPSLKLRTHRKENENEMPLILCSEERHSLAFSVLLPAKAQTKDSLEQWPEMRNTTEAAMQEAFHFPWFRDLEPIYRVS